MLLFWDRFSVSKPLSQIQRRTLFFLQQASYTPSFGGLGVKVEDSLRLRVLGLATLWLAAIAVAWVGGSPWVWLGGSIAATCGHAFSWHRRNRGLGMWPVVMAALVIALALVMRTEFLAAFDGNWLPLAHYLLLVQAIASFDIRTRGGLYAGLALSGIVLFFASQQAFGLSFGVFLLGYAGLLMAFLARAFLEDETDAAQVAPSIRRKPAFGFWSGVAAVVVLLSVGAFLLLPRGESSAVGYQEAAILPITGAPGGSEPQAQALESMAGLSPESDSAGSPSEAIKPGDDQAADSSASTLRTTDDALDEPVDNLRSESPPPQRWHPRMLGFKAPRRKSAGTRW